MFKFVDVFAGIGGFRLAFESQGGTCVWSCEWNKFSQQTYQANHGDIPAGDVTLIDADSIPDHDVFLAGFPCQPFSIAGVSKKNSLGRSHGFLDETQGTLFFDVARIIAAKQPRVVVLENGNKADSEQFSFPYHSTRVNIMIDVIDVLETEVDDKYTLSDKLWNFLQEYRAKHEAKGNGFGYNMIDPKTDFITKTLSARYYKDGSEILIKQEGKNPRRLTPRECARLMGYPDSFVIPVSDTQAYKQFGNSVVVPVVTDIAKQIAPLFKGET
jgi:DNA (cytosine-5)-methyltransferase 1